MATLPCAEPRFAHDPAVRVERPSLDIEATAPMSIITAAAMKTTLRPEWNGSVISCGKNVLPVNTSALTPGSCKAPDGSSSSAIGL